ncbi:MAG TPA: acyl-CoA dehydrogenase family protein [Amycolatopsis sp.]|uniref:acyl-CoA dehydrogenase family protein n=1 Tax=Amycolatopsis sp. TaxID=37632 RepID=UPI002B49718E|nr:acyl-CoA dehydrogenase family protein [Amycolatopsis sp.]HKS46517.1 acyl-CoA dehydrogenase family protein [Amycolatopsis sp.]
MKFALSTGQRQFAASLHDLLSGSDTPAVVRAWGQGRREPGLKLWRGLGDLGVLDLLGELGAEAADVVVAFEALGYHAVPGPLVESVVVAPLLLPEPPEFATVLAPEVPLALDADLAQVVLRLDGPAAGRVEVEKVEPVSSIDPARRLFRVTGRDTPVPGDAARAFDYAVLAVSAQLVGAGRRLLDLAVAYAKQREQYGRPIGQYQAIKHLLADVVTRLELARPLLYGAAVAIQAGEATRDVSAAKVAAGDAAYLAARTALQVHGAIGYTAEHDLGLWLTKVRALAGAWGGAAFHRRRVLAALEG